MEIGETESLDRPDQPVPHTILPPIAVIKLKTLIPPSPYGRRVGDEGWESHYTIGMLPIPSDLDNQS
jgi:hypothetical protein